LGDGSPTASRTYFNDGIGPDQCFSPGGTFPFTATASETHSYLMAGTYGLRLTVRDDDGGMREAMIRNSIISKDAHGHHGGEERGSAFACGSVADVPVDDHLGFE